MNRMVVGIDWGSRADATVVTVLDATEHKLIAQEKFAFQYFALTRERIKAIASQYSPTVILAEGNAIGQVNLEALQAEGLPVRDFWMTRQSKRDLLDALGHALSHNLINFGDNQIARQLLLKALDDEVQDDSLISMALAWWAARQTGIHIDFV